MLNSLKVFILYNSLKILFDDSFKGLILLPET